MTLIHRQYSIGYVFIVISHLTPTPTKFEVFQGRAFQFFVSTLVSWSSGAFLTECGVLDKQVITEGNKNNQKGRKEKNSWSMPHISTVLLEVWGMILVPL